MSEPRTRIALLGLDSLARKNRAQLEPMNARGYEYDVFTNDMHGDSAANLPAGNTLTVLEAGARARAAQLARYFAARRRTLHHVEVYPGGRFAAAYAGLARLYGLPVMVVERGDLLYRERYGTLTSMSMRLCYQLAHVVWYREHYQERLLRGLGARALFFLPNGVAVPADPAAASRTIDFAWVNRLIAERKPQWVVDALAEPEFAATRNAMVGFLDERRADAATLANQETVRRRALANLTLYPFSDPGVVLASARFFLLPSDIVFCNNALLEAMAAGVVPLVSDVDGSRLIVEDGVDGFVFPHTPKGLREAMRAALQLTAADHARMSRAAVAKVRSRFSMEQWGEQLGAAYERLWTPASRRRAAPGRDPGHAEG